MFPQYTGSGGGCDLSSSPGHVPVPVVVTEPGSRSGIVEVVYVSTAAIESQPVNVAKRVVAHIMPLVVAPRIGVCSPENGNASIPFTELAKLVSPETSGVPGRGF
jgi:hypothetical protein